MHMRVRVIQSKFVRSQIYLQHPCVGVCLLSVIAKKEEEMRVINGVIGLSFSTQQM